MSEPWGVARRTAAVDRHQATVITEGDSEAFDAPVLAAVVADAKLGNDTVVLDMRELLGVVDAFVVTSGRNLRHVRTLVEEVEAQLKGRRGRAPRSVEGLRVGNWVLIDYGDFLVHVFVEEARDYYDLEHLWSGAPRIEWGGSEIGI